MWANVGARVACGVTGLVLVIGAICHLVAVLSYQHEGTPLVWAAAGAGCFFMWASTQNP